MQAIKAKDKRSISAERFISSYRSGRRDFTDLIITSGRFEICTDGAEVIPIVFEGIDCANTIFKRTIFNSVKLSSSRLAGCVFEDVSFVNCSLTSIDANVSTFKEIKIYNALIDGLDLRYSELGIDMELSTILPKGITLGRNNLMQFNLFSQSMKNTGIENIKILGKVVLSDFQFNELKNAGVNTQNTIVLGTEELITVRRIQKEAFHEIPSDI